MKIYTKYCSNHSSALKNLNKMIEASPEFAKLVDVRCARQRRRRGRLRWF